jgi:cbb3-type cytochrome oxidase subunit 1
MQGLMWRAYDRFGFLQYAFIETDILRKVRQPSR